MVKVKKKYQKERIWVVLDLTFWRNTDALHIWASVLGVGRKKIRSVGSKRKCNTMKQRLQEVVTNILERENNCSTLQRKNMLKKQNRKWYFKIICTICTRRLKIQNWKSATVDFARWDHLIPQNMSLLYTSKHGPENQELVVCFKMPGFFL